VAFINGILDQLGKERDDRQPLPDKPAGDA